MAKAEKQNTVKSQQVENAAPIPVQQPSTIVQDKPTVEKKLADAADQLSRVIEELQAAGFEVEKIIGKPHDIENLTHAHQVITKQAIPMVNNGMTQLRDILEKQKG